jgi:AraC-like DNA-binding protein
MGRSGAYGESVGERFGLDRPSYLVSRAIRRAETAVTELKYDEAHHGLTNSIPREDAYLVGVQLRAVPEHELWMDGRPVRREPIAAGVTSFYDLRRDPVALLISPYHCLMFYFPRAVFDAVADDGEVGRIGDLRPRPGIGSDDPTMRALAMSLLPALERPAQVNRLFFEHVTLAGAAHIARTYGGMQASRLPSRGGLAPWQVRRATEILSANLDGEISQKQIASECGLSAGHFSRAFKESTGLAPHRWLLRRRVEVATDLLLSSRMSLTDVALACGFAHQSHFTRTFSREIGMTPASWRRKARMRLALTETTPE